MSDVAIRVEGLGKKYRLGAATQPYRTLRESLMDVSTAPLRAASRLTRRPAGAGTRGSRPEFWALRDVGLEVAQGEVLGIIGRNGAGKSTLLKILSQITEPTEGTITIRGHVASLLEVGTGFHPELTGRENVFLNGAILGMARREIMRKFDEIVAFAEVEKFIDTPVKHYSSGMYMRLAFSVAAHLEPEILVVDEVLAVGDTAFQKKCLGKMGAVAKEGRTVLFVSHNMGAIKQLCERCVLLDRGQVSTQGDVDTVVQTYLSHVERDAAVVDLTAFNNTYGHHELEVVSLELVNAVASSFSVRWDEPIIMKTRIKVNQALSNVSLGIGCATADGVSLFTVRSADQEDHGHDLPAQQWVEWTTTIQHNLRAGYFTILIGIASGNYNYYFNPSVATLQVLDVGTKDYPYRNYGMINCGATWRLERGES